MSSKVIQASGHLHSAIEYVGADDRKILIPVQIGGHPNTLTKRATYAAAQTNTAIVSASAGSRLVVTKVSAMCDKANTVDVGLIVGFGATTTPTTDGVVLTHPGVAPGSGLVEGTGGDIIGIGADGEDLRITSEAPTNGSLEVLVTYFEIPS